MDLLKFHFSFGSKILFDFFGFPITNTFLISFLIGIFLSFFFYLSFKDKKILPHKLQNFAGLILETILKYIDLITKDRKKSLEIFPLSATLFIFIFCCNLIEIFPGLGIFPFLKSPSSDLNFTLALAITSMAILHLKALKNLKFNYLKKYFNFESPILFFIGIMELSSEFTRTLALALRLFGNLFCGEILLILAYFLFPPLFSLPFLGLEILVGFLQALIFAFLIVIFYTLINKV